MELRRRLDLRMVLAGLYVLLLGIYIIVGLQPADATRLDVAAELSIPAIDLTSDVTNLKLNGTKLDTPATIVGSYSQAKNKTLLIGHSTTVFENLNQVQVGNEIDYGGKKYVVKESEILAKVEIDMNELLAGAETDTLVVMTCAGELLGGGDATHRLIITATIED